MERESNPLHNICIAAATCPRALSSGCNVIVRYEESNWSSSTVSVYKIILFNDFFKYENFQLRMTGNDDTF
jgi:hypothetical protein